MKLLVPNSTLVVDSHVYYYLIFAFHIVYRHKILLRKFYKATERSI